MSGALVFSARCLYSFIPLDADLSRSRTPVCFQRCAPVARLLVTPTIWLNVVILRGPVGGQSLLPGSVVVWESGETEFRGLACRVCSTTELPALLPYPTECAQIAELVRVTKTSASEQSVFPVFPPGRICGVGPQDLHACRFSPVCFRFIRHLLSTLMDAHIWPLKLVRKASSKPRFHPRPAPVC